MNDKRPFWKTKRMADMTRAEWESLCDGCGKCCLVKLREETTNEVFATDVACHLLDTTSCRCSRYRDRQKHVPSCVALTPDTVADLDFLPTTCAYRLVAHGKPLPWWHHLVSGDPSLVHKAGMSVRERVISETEVPDEDDWVARIVKWAR